RHRGSVVSRGSPRPEGERVMDWKVPELGEGVYEAELVVWHVKPGDAVKRGQNLMEVMTDKATMEVPSSFAGTVTALNAEPGKNIKVGEAVLVYTPADKGDGGATEAATRRRGDGEKKASGAQSNGGKPVTVAAPARPRASVAGDRVAASPAVRYMARKL